MEKVKKCLLVLIMVISITFFCVGCGKNSKGDNDDEPAKVDFDLTTMSAVEMDSILAYLPTYMDKTMRIEGKYTYATYYGDGYKYHILVVDGAAACCSPEFTFTNYPPINTRIQIEGKISKYVDIHDGKTYYYIDATSMVNC